MEPKKRNVLVFAIALTIIAGIIASFGLPFFYREPDLSLPRDEEGPDPQGGSSFFLPDGEELVLVQVTLETVQEVIATLHRQESFYRELSIEETDPTGRSFQSVVQVWEDKGVTKSAIMSPDGTLQYHLVVDETAYLWYAGDRNWYEFPAAEGERDLAVRILSYEDILSLKPSQILAASFETKNEKNCIRVDVLVESLGYTERFWVSVDSGLLVAAETEKDGAILYRMEERLQTTLAENAASFALPNGKVLHTVL